MMKKKIILLGLVLFLVFFYSGVSYAQCAMCRATVENNVSSGSRIGSGLNSGILYLAAVPYLVFIVITYLWYRNSKKNYVKRNLKNISYS